MVGTIVNGLKVAGKFVVVTFAAAVGAEVGFNGGQALFADGLILSKKAPKPVVVKTSGFGPFKKATVKVTNPITGDASYCKVKVRKVKKQPVKK